MSGSWDLFDFDDLTAWSESSPRTRAIDTLQVHHGTIISYSGLRSLMDPGGRTVSANGAMSNEGALGEVVRTFDRRAFTSASSFDNQCLTVECCNTTLGPQWGISEKTRIRLAHLAVGMYRKGLLRGLYRGVGGVLGHNEVPGSYATACPGPDMHLDHVVMLANQIYNAVTPIERYLDMSNFYLVRRVSDGDPVLGGMQCAMGPGYFRHLGPGDLEGIARDLGIPASQIVDGTDPAVNGLPAIEFARLISLFLIPPEEVKPGGFYLK